MLEKKKRKIRKIIKRYQTLLDLSTYRVTSRFKTAKQDKDMKRAYAVVEVNNKDRIIYIKLNLRDFNRMKIKDIKHLVLHELLHSFFWELSDLFDEVLKKTYLTKKKEEKLKTKFDELEHRRIRQLLKILMRIDHSKPLSKKQ